MLVTLDPTLLLTRRGWEWVSRAHDQSCSAFGTSGNLLVAIDQRDPAALRAYRPLLRFGRWDPWHGPRTFQRPIQSVHFDPADEVARRLVLAGMGGRIAADLWAALTEGGLLAARRFPTFDLLVQAEVRLVVEGGASYDRLTSLLEPEIRCDLAAALLRRTRYLAASTRLLAGFEHPQPTVLVSDAGPGRY